MSNDRLTAIERILRDLSDGEWVCGSHWLNDYLYVYSQRVSNINAKQPGRIVSEVCHDHVHRGTIARYRDTHALRPTQMRLVG